MSGTIYLVIILTSIWNCNFRFEPTFFSSAQLCLQRTKSAYRPSTKNAHHTHLRTYLSFAIFMQLPVEPSVHSLLAFLEYLHINSFSHKVILNYLSSIKKASIKYSWNSAPFSHRLVTEYLRSISINTKLSPTHRGIFDLSTFSRTRHPGRSDIIQIHISIGIL